MGSLPPTTVLVLVLACVLACAAAVAAVVVVRAGRASRRQQDAELARARAEVDSLHERLDQLSDEVVRSRQEAEQQRRRDLEHREYVITSLAATGGTPEEPVLPRPAPVQVLEEQLVAALARQQGRSPLRTRAVDVAVRTVALGHGVRRALTPANLDRAAAESHVTRRRSRRARKQELRQARRLVRAVRTHRAAATSGRHAA
jgi:TolA-binding protein